MEAANVNDKPGREAEKMRLITEIKKLGGKVDRRFGNTELKNQLSELKKQKGK